MTTPPPPYTAQDHLGPYLRLSHRLSLAPFAFPIVAVAFVALRFYLSLQSAKNLVGDAKELVIAGCLGAQRAASAAVSVPRWMALETNEQLVQVAKDTFESSRSGLTLSLTVLEEIIVFVVETFGAFYLCLGQFVIRGGLAAIITVVQYVETGLQSLGDTLTSTVDALNSALSSTISAINSALSIFSSVEIPSLSVPTDSLSITVPDTLSSSLIDLNSSIPTLNELREDLEDLISIPFESLKGRVNETFQDLQVSFSPDLLPAPAVRSVEFCNDIDLSPIDTAGDKLIRIIQTIAGVLVALAVIMMIVNVIWQYYRWRSLQAAVTSISDSWQDPSLPPDAPSIPIVQLTHDNILVLQSQITHGFRTKYLNSLRRTFHLHPSTTNGMAWFIEYVTYPPALMCLLIGLIGLIAVLVQLALIGPLEKEFADLEGLVVANYTTQITDAINEAMEVDSVAYATAVNGWMDSTSSTIDEDVFGLVSVASDAVNNTVVRFYTDVETGIRDALSGTVLGDSVVEVLRCIVGNKIFALSDGLEWLRTHLHISLPRVDPQLLLLRAGGASEMAAPIAGAASQNPSGDEGGILSRIIVAYKKILKGEMILFTVFLGIWGVVVLSACLILLVHSILARRKARKAREGMGGRVKESEKSTSYA